MQEKSCWLRRENIVNLETEIIILKSFFYDDNTTHKQETKTKTSGYQIEHQENQSDQKHSISIIDWLHLTKNQLKNKPIGTIEAEYQQSR